MESLTETPTESVTETPTESHLDSSGGLGIPLSVLDLSPVSAGSTPADALRSSTELIGVVERLGYTRYWVAEHHNMPGIASSSPPVLLAHLAAHSERIRLGSGGVMLPNHAPLVVAEQFGMLVALHPGRIDLGIGRAPGTDQLTAEALRRTSPQADDFPERLVELRAYFSGEFPANHRYRGITATPGKGYAPSLWLLGSSNYSAYAAGVLGLPFSFAHHFAAENTLPAVDTYLEHFTPSDDLAEPYVMLGVNVVCAPTEEEAQYLAGSGTLSFVRLRQGRPGPLPTPEEAASHDYSPAEAQVIRQRRASQIVGDPTSVERQLRELAERTQANELMITTMVHDPALRIRSYELVAESCLAGTSVR
ncbi:MAG: LLM class flavin-dependent oxidoreductase [Ilumatobacteraceae bacterium]